MIGQLTQMDYWMETFWNEHGDPRTAHFPLMSSFRIPLGICLSYYFIVLYAGPRFMANREPFSLKPLLVVYNLTLSVVNFFFFCKILHLTNYGVEALNVDLHSSDNSYAKNDDQLIYFWAYFISKYIDMFDTIFFVLRKKQSQISGLHVYHHSMVPTFGWIYLRHSPFNIAAAVFTILNAPIHMIMYAYYGLAAIGPHMQKYLWWKRYITQIQIFQFILLFLYAVYFSTYQKGYSKFYVLDILIQSVLYFVLFIRFYLQNYRKNNIKNE